MRRLVFPFTTEDIIVATPDEVSDLDWEKINTALLEKINAIFLALHPGDPKSNLYQLHESGVGYAVSILPELQELLAINDYYHNLSQGKFKLIEPKCLEFDPTNLTVSRLDSSHIQVTKLFTEYTLQMLDRILRQSPVQNYLITGPRAYICRGTQSWEIVFPHPQQDQPVEMVVQDQSTLINYTTQVSSAQPALTPFGGVDPNLPKILGVIIEATDPIHAKVISSLIFENQADFQFQRFVDQWKCGATLLYSDGSYRQFTHS